MFDSVAELFGLLVAAIRLRIVCAPIEGESNVSELLERVAVSQPNISQNMWKLYRGGVLARRRTGAQIYYRVEHAEVHRLCRALKFQSQPAELVPSSRAGRRGTSKAT